MSKARQNPFPYTSRLSPEYILKHAERLLKDFQAERNSNGQGFGICTNLALQFQGLERQERGQQGIEGFFGGEKASLEAKTVKRQRPPSPSAKLVSTSIIIVDEGIESPPIKVKKKSKKNDLQAQRVFFRCDRCSKVIHGESAEEDAVTALRQEHADWHFATDLMQQERVTVGTTSAFNRDRAKVNAKVKPKGTLSSFWT